MNWTATVNKILGTDFGCKEETVFSSFIPKIPVSNMYPEAFVHAIPDLNLDAPVSCIGCGAPLNCKSKCEYCGRLYPKHPEISTRLGVGRIHIPEA